MIVSSPRATAAARKQRVTLIGRPRQPAEVADGSRCLEFERPFLSGLLHRRRDHPNRFDSATRELERHEADPCRPNDFACRIALFEKPKFLGARIAYQHLPKKKHSY